MDQKENPPENTLKSEALKNLEKNLDQVMAFLKRIDMKQLLQKTEALHDKVMAELATAPRTLEGVREELAAYDAFTNEWREFQRPAMRWISVMLVSFLEAYLEDSLAEIARVNPRVVREQKIEPHKIFEVDTLEELRREIRLNWAHNVIRPGGPKTWSKILRELGAEPIDRKVVEGLQHLWDTRNLIVHSSCIADALYAEAYEKLGAKPNAEVLITLDIFGGWLDSATAFVEAADKFLLAYGKKSRQ